MLLFASLSSLEKKPKQKSEKYRLRINHYFRLHELHLGLSEPGPQILTEQLTPSQPEGRFCPLHFYLALRLPGFSDLPRALNGCM